MQSNRIVVILANDGVSGLDVSYGKNINTVYLNSHLYNEFVVRPNFTLGAGQTMFVTFRQGDLATKPLLLAARQTTKQNSTQQVVDGTSSTIEQIPDNGWEYYMQLPDVILKNVGEWKFSLTIAELPVDVNYKGTVAAVANLPSSGNSVGDTYYVTAATSYYYWSGTAWALLTISALSTSDIGTFTVNASVAGDIGGTATDLDIIALYSFVVNIFDNLSDYLPKIGDNGNWWIWNSTAKGYIDTSVNAEGVQVFYLGAPLKYQDNTTITVGALYPTGKNVHVGDLVMSSRVQSVGGSLENRSGLGRIISITDNTAKVSWMGYVTGEQGAQGEKGDKGDTGATGAQGAKGADGVGIANVSQEVVTGGTKVTITLTNGTSSSFIVYNGTADNITNLEFPHGDSVVTYDNTDGLHIHGNCRITLNGTNYDVPMDVEVPQTAGDGLTEDATDDAKGAVLKVDETVVRTNKANQIINGNVTIGGNVTVNGTVTSVSAENLKVKNKLIVVAEGNTVTLTSPAGLLAPKYDGTNSGALVFDGTGTAYVGDVVLDENGDIDVTKSDLQPLVTRGALVNGNLPKWDSTKTTLIDSGIAADQVALKSDVGKAGNFIYTLNYESATVPTVGQVLTLTNANFSRTPIVGDEFVLMEVVNTKDTYFNNMQVLTVGDTTCTAKIMSFTDITSGKLDKVTSATTGLQFYAKAPNGSQVMTEIKGGNGITVDAASDNKSLEVRVGDTIYITNDFAFSINDTNNGVDMVKFYGNYIDLDPEDDTSPSIKIAGYSGKDWQSRWYGDKIKFIRAAVSSNTQSQDGPIQFAPISPYYEITDVPTSATSGTLPNDQSYSALTDNPQELRLLFNKEFYQLSDNEHTTGTLVFSHVGYEDSQLIIKTITITIATRAWVLTTITPAAEPYYVELSGSSGTLTTEQYNGLVADNNSYIVRDSSKFVRAGYNSASGTLTYSHSSDTQLQYISIYGSRNWNFSAVDLQETNYRTETISNSSDDKHYPSARAAYVYGQTVLTEAKEYADTAIANAITTALNTPV